jgi:hypothetical protein
MEDVTHHVASIVCGCMALTHVSAYVSAWSHCCAAGAVQMAANLGHTFIGGDDGEVEESLARMLGMGDKAGRERAAVNDDGLAVSVDNNGGQWHAWDIV